MMDTPEDDDDNENAAAPIPTVDDFTWTSSPNPPVPFELRRELFSEVNVGPTIPYADPYEAFVAIWDRPIIEHICLETNRYAQQLRVEMINERRLLPTSRICDWKDVTEDDVYVYLAMILAMGLVVKARLKDYWNADEDIFSTPGFHVHMSLRKFQLLSRCLHFCNNEDMCTKNLDASHAKLFKIQPIIQHLNNKFQSLYNLGRNIVIDESLLQSNGRLDSNQFKPIKVAAVGIKTYEICEPQTGYIWRFFVHAHRRQTRNAPTDTDLSSTSLILKLLEGLEHKGHTVWMDNFYNSPALARKLKTLNFDCVGTLRTNRQYVPKKLTNLTKAKMKKGQITGYTSGDVDLMVWRDQNRVATISTYHGVATIQINGVTKPTLIHDYNIMMGGVDNTDQLLAVFPIERKRTKVWYKKLFRRLVNVSTLNAFILFKGTNHSQHRDFRTILVKTLLERHSRFAHKTIHSTIATAQVDWVKQHHLDVFACHPNTNTKNRRKCVVCKKRVSTFCVGCSKTVCIKPCFMIIHN
ncbi:piggyBac transposable element-derived protein 4-like [Cydia pomonella]|uniref:piggyBac transposable element-derived protein 4-like n=1 Tax=Cydia pomonella TaxID=82600 RepID=UPI002ADE694B|nr:piggyBac transposable element-derived protein 4-like [Cydia pomonella]